jgi:hypothetical protein
MVFMGTIVLKDGKRWRAESEEESNSDLLAAS